MESTRTTKPLKREPEVKPVDPFDPAIVLTYAELDGISRTLKKTIDTKDGLLAAIAALTTISVEGVPVVLEPRLLQRLQSRCFDKPNWPQWLAGVVVRQLHDYAGW